MLTFNASKTWVGQFSSEEHFGEEGLSDSFYLQGEVIAVTSFLHVRRKFPQEWFRGTEYPAS